MSNQDQHADDLARFRELDALRKRTPKEEVERSRLAHSLDWVPLADVLPVISAKPYGGTLVIGRKKRNEEQEE